MIGDYIVAFILLILANGGLRELIGTGTMAYIVRIVIGVILWFWISQLIEKKDRRKGS